ncbi:actin family [Pelagophyceae sp. CCMP2097]|nr:actin family [Pelagophyceae sp. CCMP2097]
MEGGDCIVIDAGSASVKAGYSGEDTPRSVFPSIILDDGGPPASVARRRAPANGGKASAMSTSSGGRRAESAEFHFDSAASHPIQHGVVLEGNWEKMEHLWDLTFGTYLKQYPEAVSTGGSNTHGHGYAVLLAEAPGTPAAARERAAQIMFETFKVPAICFFNSASLSLFASGRTRGIVLECGAGAAHAVPVFEGFALAHAVLRSELAGQDVTAALSANLRRAGHALPFDVVREMKEKLCRVSPRDSPAEPGGSLDVVEYELPDGTMVRVAAQAVSAAPQVLFAGRGDELPLHELVARAVAMCDRDFQLDLRAAVVLAGGTTMLPGLCDRLQAELADALPPGPLRVVPGPHPTGAAERGYNAQRKWAAWIGGSMFASLETFKQCAVTKQEWEDDESIVHRKAF